MPARYFEMFPNTTYSNAVVKDIMVRTAFVESANSGNYVYYDYVVSDNERPDQLADRYYGDPYYSWLIYVTNNIIDPYYGWHMNEGEFTSFIEKKYGSIDAANRKIRHYESTNVGASWISPGDFDALPLNLRRFWQIETDRLGEPLRYVRRPETLTVSTNAVRRYELDVYANTYSQDEVVSIVLDTGLYGEGQVSGRVANTLFVQHVSGVTSGNTLPNGASCVRGIESGANGRPLSATTVAQTIPTDETEYFTPISYLEYETKLNESRRMIRVLDSRLAYDAYKKIGESLRG
jgi:hypothetical protein